MIGLRGRTDDGLRGTLLDAGVSYAQVELDADGDFDLDAIGAAIRPTTRMLHVQRSRGYSVGRPSIRLSKIERCARRWRVRSRTAGTGRRLSRSSSHLSS